MSLFSRKTGKLVELIGCRTYSVTERCVKLPVVVPHSILDENSKSGITQDLSHSCKYANSFEAYGSCNYDDSNIVDVKSVSKENKINTKTTFFNKYDDNNTVDVRNENKVRKVNVKSTSVNDHNNSDNEKPERKRCYVCLCKEEKRERFSVCGG